MNKLNLLAISTMIILTGLYSCTEKEGCTDINAINYDTENEGDNSSCTYSMNELKGAYTTTAICNYGIDTDTTDIILLFNDSTNTLFTTQSIEDGDTGYLFKGSIIRGDILLSNEVDEYIEIDTISSDTTHYVATISGFGSLSGSTVSIEYTIETKAEAPSWSGTFFEICTFTGTKQ